MREAQRAFLADGDAVAEGRDIGEVVWPQAELKVWLDAAPEIARAAAAARAARAGARPPRQRADAASPTTPSASTRTRLSVDDVVERSWQRARARSARP